MEIRYDFSIIITESGTFVRLDNFNNIVNLVFLIQVNRLLIDNFSTYSSYCQFDFYMSRT